MTMMQPLELGELWREHYDDLKKLAEARIRRFPSWWSLDSTDLVHETFLRLHKRGHWAWQSRSHFCGAAAQAMHDAVVAYVRGKHANRCGGLVRTGSMSALGDGRDVQLALDDKVAVFQALERLSAEYPRHAEVMFLYFFCSMTMSEIADWLGVTTRTVERRWRFAQAWLWRELGSH